MKDIFLCHTGADKPWVERLAARLEAEKIGGRPIDVFFDKWDINYGENILTRIEEALKASRFLGVVMSPAFTRADWPRLEWQTRVWKDPTGKAASILPILLHRNDPETGEPIELPLPLQLLKWLDFSEPKRFESEFQELLRRLRGEPPRRGGGGAGPRGSGPVAFVPPDAPDRCEESLVSNLLRVTRHPTRVWSDLTSARRYPDVWSVLRGKFRPPFVLDNGRLYSFYPPGASDNPFRTVLTGTAPREERPVDWLDDPVRARWLMWLYNDALREHAFALEIRTPRRAGKQTTSKDRQQFFCPTFNGRPREFRWAADVRPRTLAKIAERPDGSKFGVHQAARMRFIGLGGDAYLLVEPGWFFTEDGVTPLEGRQVGVLSTRWGGRERNGPVLRNILMWGLLLSRGRPTVEVPLGAETLVLDAVPAHARMLVGVEGDQMRLDRVLRGESAGAGEVAHDDAASPYAEEPDGRLGGEADELDHLAALEASGALEVVLAAEAATRDRDEGPLEAAEEAEPVALADADLAEADAASASESPPAPDTGRRRGRKKSEGTADGPAADVELELPF